MCGDNPMPTEEYVAALVSQFQHDWAWELYAVVDMPEKLLQEMRDNIAKYVPQVCAQEKDVIKEILEFYGKNRYFKKNFRGNIVSKTYDSKEMCKDFIKNAKKHELWSEKAQKNYGLKTNRVVQEMFEGAVAEGQQSISY